MPPRDPSDPATLPTLARSQARAHGCVRPRRGAWAGHWKCIARRCKGEKASPAAGYLTGMCHCVRSFVRARARARRACAHARGRVEKRSDAGEGGRKSPNLNSSGYGERRADRRGTQRPQRGRRSRRRRPPCWRRRWRRGSGGGPKRRRRQGPPPQSPTPPRSLQRPTPPPQKLTPLPPPQSLAAAMADRPKSPPQRLGRPEALRLLTPGPSRCTE